MGRVLTILLEDHHIQLAVVSLNKRGRHLIKAVKRELPDGLLEDGTIRDKSKTAALLTAILKEEGIKEKKVIFTISSGKIMYRELILPPMREREILQTIKTNAEEYFPVKLKNYVFSYFKLDGEPVSRLRLKRRRRRVMALAAPDDMIQSYYDMAEMARLKILSLDYSGNSLFHILRDEVGEGNCLAIRIKEDYTVVSVFSHKELMFQRNMDYGMKNISEGEAEYFLSNIERVGEYFRVKEEAIERIWLWGEGENIQKMLEERLGLPVYTFARLLNIKPRKNGGLEEGVSIDYMENMGAAIAPVRFLSEKMEREAEGKREIGICRSILLLSLLASLVLLAAPAMEYVNLLCDKMELESSLTRLRGTKKIFEDYEEAEGMHRDWMAVEEAVYTNNEHLEEFISAVEQICPDDISITSFTCENGQVAFSAASAGKEPVISLVRRLREINCVTDVDISGLSSIFEEDGREYTDFSITCLLNGGVSNRGEREYWKKPGNEVDE